MASKLHRLGALALAAAALTLGVHGKSTTTHGPTKGPKAPINSTTVDGGGRSFG